MGGGRGEFGNAHDAAVAEGDAAPAAAAAAEEEDADEERTRDKGSDMAAAAAADVAAHVAAGARKNELFADARRNASVVRWFMVEVVAGVVGVGEGVWGQQQPGSSSTGRKAKKVVDDFFGRSVV